MTETQHTRNWEGWPAHLQSQAHPEMIEEGKGGGRQRTRARAICLMWRPFPYPKDALDQGEATGEGGRLPIGQAHHSLYLSFPVRKIKTGEIDRRG